MDAMAVTDPRPLRRHRSPSPTPFNAHTRTKYANAQRLGRERRPGLPAYTDPAADSSTASAAAGRQQLPSTTLDAREIQDGDGNTEKMFAEFEVDVGKLHLEFARLHQDEPAERSHFWGPAYVPAVVRSSSNTSAKVAVGQDRDQPGPDTRCSTTVLRLPRDLVNNCWSGGSGLALEQLVEVWLPVGVDGESGKPEHIWAIGTVLGFSDSLEWNVRPSLDPEAERPPPAEAAAEPEPEPEGAAEPEGEAAATEPEPEPEPVPEPAEPTELAAEPEAEAEADVEAEAEGEAEGEGMVAEPEPGATPIDPPKCTAVRLLATEADEIARVHCFDGVVVPTEWVLPLRSAEWPRRLLPQLDEAADDGVVIMMSRPANHDTAGAAGQRVLGPSVPAEDRTVR